MQELDNPTVAETKRFLELYTGIQSYKQEVDANCNITEAPFGFRFKPSSVRAIYDADYLLSQQEKGIELNPRSEKGYLNMGRILKQEGAKEKALSYFESAIQCNPDNRATAIEMKALMG